MGLFTPDVPEYHDPSEKTEKTEKLIHYGHFEENDILVCATHGKIYAIHKSNGARLWRTKFPRGFDNAISLFVTDYGKLFAGAKGRTLCIEIMTGNIIWLNKMKGFGTNEVSVISTRRNFPPLENHYTTTIYQNNESVTKKPVVFGSTRGKIMAINSETGEEIWKYNCPGGRFKIPVVIMDPVVMKHGSPEEQLIFVGSGRWVYCLKSTTGDVVWSCRISNAIVGADYMTLATCWSSRIAAETYSAFSQNPTAQSRDRKREEERKSAG